jgi:hypothetical protein
MDGSTTTPETPAGPTLPTWVWLLGVLALLTWQGWLTLALFGDDPRETLLNDQPIVAGTHPQSLYLGTVGSIALLNQGRSTTYDWSNLNGYPKTPIFDGGRLAELLLLLGGGTYQPAAYKVGFAILCLLIPCFLLLTAKSLGIGNLTSLIATFLGQLIWWGPHGRSALMTGDCELYLASLAALAHVGSLIAFHRSTSISSWFGLLITGAVGWYLQPMLFPIALPVLLTYYLSVGERHDFLTWHVAFWWVEILALLVNVPWLIDWVDSWWLRTALPSAVGLLEHRTIRTIWDAPLWGGETGRFLALILIASAAVGNIILHQTGERTTARLLGTAAAGALVLALLGISWEPLGVVGTAALFAPSLWFACIPAAHAWIWTFERLWRFGGSGRLLAGMTLATLIGVFSYWNEIPQHLLTRCLPGEPLDIGLGPRREAIVQTLIARTDTQARILWEERDCNRLASRWAALLPILTKRSYIGGLDPDGLIEHSSITLNRQNLAGQPIAVWTESEFLDYCRRYNVRWIAAWSPAVVEKLEEWPSVKKSSPLVDDVSGWLFEVDRTPTYALKGKADVVDANGQSITFANVEPDNGEVIISLHYQAGMRAYPGRVQVERANYGGGLIDFVRLRLAVPAARVTLTWERP